MKLSDLAAKARRDPYLIELADGTTVSVPQPTVDGWTEACKADDVFGVLAMLGVDEDDATALRAELAGVPMSTDYELMNDMRAHFQLGN